MVGEVISRSYDSVGKIVSRPSKKRHRFFKPTFPMGAYVSQPIPTKCKDLTEIRRFLITCRYVSDPMQFGQRDYWMLPQEFEERKKGDCDDLRFGLGGNSFQWDMTPASSSVIQDDMAMVTHG